MNTLYKLGEYLYAYCTDFIINLANLFGWSYYEVNALIFCIVWPLLTLLLFGVFVMQLLRLRQWEAKKKTSIQ